MTKQLIANPSYATSCGPSVIPVCLNSVCLDSATLPLLTFFSRATQTNQYSYANGTTNVLVFSPKTFLRRSIIIPSLAKSNLLLRTLVLFWTSIWNLNHRSRSSSRLSFSSTEHCKINPLPSTLATGSGHSLLFRLRIMTSASEFSILILTATDCCKPLQCERDATTWWSKQIDIICKKQ